MNRNLRQPFLLGQAPRSFGKCQTRFGDEEGRRKEADLAGRGEG